MATSSDRAGTGSKSGTKAREVSGRSGTWVSEPIGSGTGGVSREKSSTTGTQGSGGKGSGGGRPTTSGTATSGTGTSGAGRPGGPRRIRLTLARLDPFSVMKLSFLVAIAIGIATVVCVAVLWNLVNAMGLWDTLDQLGKDLNNGKELPFMQFFTFSKMVSYATIVSIIDVVIITALGTLFAFLYNIVAGLLGGLKMMFTDE